eukprot:1542703-Rhodomonas_salina.3
MRAITLVAAEEFHLLKHRTVTSQHVQKQGLTRTLAVATQKNRFHLPVRRPGNVHHVDGRRRYPSRRSTKGTRALAFGTRCTR